MKLKPVYLSVIFCIIFVKFVVGFAKFEQISDCYVHDRSSHIAGTYNVTFICSISGKESDVFPSTNRFKCSNRNNNMQNIWLGTINFKYCQFGQLRRNFFVDFPNMHTFNISDIGMEILELKYFVEAKNVSHLIASKNKITEIPSHIFINANKLKYVDFANNTIQKIDASAFEGAYELETLNLSQNALTELDERVFTNLSNLLHLDLSKNNVKTLPKHIFNQNTKLIELNLAFNPIGNVKIETFANLPDLKYLNLRRTNISSIELGTFSHQHKLVSLDLAENYLKQMEFNIFIPMLPDLVSLYLNGNQLTSLNGFENELFPQLTLLDIRGNNFNCTYLQHFLKSVNWDKLRLPVDPKSVVLSAGETSIRSIKCKPTIDTNLVINEPNYEVKLPKNVLIEQCSKLIHKSHTDTYLITLIIVLLAVCVMLFIANRRKYFNVPADYDQGIELS
ncbi:leucine-rich repeat-containing G-protein coupled receptor 5-like [Contarinia nasturtii]|uniref:leucine-rich repeat-containing G-protein coupled receptor 5-like n=1 Tax=Contarinia nasturtii TaxID=265458 RepID=UPI0012D498EE|nr:leucine-rich repeat-containing G-protein coupled receptor 5-like [Contarinia nasturtii]